MMKILILGGTGAIGSFLLEHLSLTEHKIFVTSRQNIVSTHSNIIYLKGNAHEPAFLESILDSKYDVIVDFMNYATDEFANRISLLLNMTDQYIFLSSARVYAECNCRLQENNVRLLDTAYKGKLSPDSYALAKARQEDLLKQQTTKNWTIIRPYITYSSERFQLGIYEKEQWLYRILNGHTVCLTNELANKQTSMTSGRDVAKYISKIMGNPKALGQIIQIATPEIVSWRDICDIYVKAIQEITQTKPSIVYKKDIGKIHTIIKCKDKFHYDRMYDRMFDCHLLEKLIDEPLSFIPIREGLPQAIQAYLKKDQTWKKISWIYEGYADKLTNERTPLKQIPTVKSQIKYLLGRVLI